MDFAEEEEEGETPWTLRREEKEKAHQ